MSSFCDYSDAFILATGDVTVTCFYVFIDEANHIYTKMPMYNLIEYSDNYSDTSGRSWQFKIDEVPNNNDDFTIDNSQSFKCKAVLRWKTQMLLIIQIALQKKQKLLFH